jgi:hypothetical protein
VSDSSTPQPTAKPKIARRALFVAAGSAVALGAACPAAFADDFDGQHLSANQGLGCAGHELQLTADNVLNHGRLPETFNNFKAGGAPGDGVAALCHAVDEKKARDTRQGPLGLLGGLPPHASPAEVLRNLPVGATPLGQHG